MRDPVAFLTAQLAAIERERDALLVKSQRLETLQRTFVEITAAKTEESLAMCALRGAWLALGFSRAIWFASEPSGSVSAMYDWDGGEPRESEYGDVLPAGSSIYRIARGESDAATGYAEDPDAPLFETRRWYALAAVRVRSGAAAIIYADGSVERSVSAWSVTAITEVAQHAALALENMRMAAELERLALHDPLTGLFNRRALMDRLATELASARRTGEMLAYAMIDVDDFKGINDVQGHAGGDAALQTLAGILRARTRETDVPARFAGDEFSIVMPRTDRDAAAFVMDRIFDALRAASLECSVGISFFPMDGSDEETLMEAADRAVYAAKAAGKNCYRLS